MGSALHTGIEKGVEAAIKEYYAAYPIISDEHVTQALKLEMQIEKARAVVPDGEFEVLVETEKFRGYIDLLEPVGPDEYNIWDFKYTNNVEHYMESRQLHLYKYYFERAHPGKKINSLFFLFVPKNNSKPKKDETLYHFRERVLHELEPTSVQQVKVEYDPGKVIEHLELMQDIHEAVDYPCNVTWACKFCDYYDYCQKGRDYMLLPSSERRNISETKKRKIWIYGAAFSGKTTFLDDAPNPLNLNTDGNIQFVTMPYVSIRDEVTVEGRITKRKYAWEIFKETITELEKKQNDFQTIIIDLLEDTREACRVYMYNQLNIQHESDSGYGKGWDIIKTEYLSTLRRFFNLDYENLVVVSHEDTSKDITKKDGRNITKIAPNIQEAIAHKVAGMVDIVARVVVEDDDTRTLNFKSNEVIFGGGRLKGVKETTIPLSWDALMEVYDEANDNVKAKRPSQSREKAPETTGAEKVESLPPEERKPVERDSEPLEGEEWVNEDKTETPPEPVEAAPATPKKRTRRKRDE